MKRCYTVMVCAPAAVFQELSPGATLSPSLQYIHIPLLVSTESRIPVIAMVSIPVVPWSFNSYGYVCSTGIPMPYESTTSQGYYTPTTITVQYVFRWVTKVFPPVATVTTFVRDNGTPFRRDDYGTHRLPHAG